MTSAARQAHDPGSSDRFNPDEPVHDLMPDGSRYCESRWDYQPIAAPSLGSRWVDFTKLPIGYHDDAKVLLLLLGRPTHPEAFETGVILRRKPASANRVFTDYYLLVTIAAWGAAHGLRNLTEWTQPHATQLVDDLRAGTHRDKGEPVGPSTVRTYISLLQTLAELRPIMPHPLSFTPWRGRTAMEVAGEVQLIENSEKPLDWDVWAPLMRATSTIITTCGPTIVRADRLLREARVGAELSRGPGGDAALRRVRAYLDGGGRIPLHTGFGRGGGQPRGAVNDAMIARLAGISANTFTQAHHAYSPAARALIDNAVCNGQCIFGGLLNPDATDEDGWVGELGLAEAEYLPSVLRAACYVQIASLSGMRDSELQSLQRGALQLDRGIPILHGRQYKHREPGGQERAWWVPTVVATAIDMLTDLTRSERLFARTTRRGVGGDDGSYDASRDLKRLLAFINDPTDQRAGRGRNFGLDPIRVPRGQRITAGSLRRSFAVYAAMKPGAEIGIGIQLGHAALRTTTGYMSDSGQSATRMFTNARATVVREELHRLLTSEESIAGASGGRLEDLRAQVIADPARADQVIDRAAKAYHLGIVNDCNYRAETAACGPDGPHLATHFCATDNCHNAVVHGAHMVAIDAQIARLDVFLNSGKYSPAFEPQVRRQRAGLIALRTTIQRKETR